MTHFYHGQLIQLYDLFVLDGFCHVIGETHVPLYTGHRREYAFHQCREEIQPSRKDLTTGLVDHDRNGSSCELEDPRDHQFAKPCEP